MSKLKQGAVNAEHRSEDMVDAPVFKRERLHKILSAHGISSRREAERMILDGRVFVNDVQATLGQSATVGLDNIVVDGAELTAVTERFYIMLNKPRGFVTTLRDERGRKTVMELVTDIDARIYPVGRLDMDSEGLLLLTNDGEFANSVMHPSNDVQKVYEADIRGDASAAALQLRQPVEIDKHIVKATKVELSKLTHDGGVLRITIVEGRNRQVRKMCAACGVSVRSLKRVSIGELRLGKLKPGHWRHLTKDEIALF